MDIDKLGEKTASKTNLSGSSNISGTVNKNNDNIGTATSDKVVITKKHVKEFTPLLKKDINITIPEEHQKWINLFKVLEEHGLSVAGTETKEELHKTLERIYPSDRPITFSYPSYSLFGGTKCLDIKIGKDAKSNENEIVTIYLPNKQVESLAQHLNNYKATKEKANDINTLKDLVSKGAELYLEIPPENRFSSNDKLPPRFVKVSPEVFNWFMNNPTYMRVKGVGEIGMEAGISMMIGCPFPALLPYVTAKKTVINGGMIDAKADGQPNEPSIHGKNWEEFSANLKELSHRIDINTKEEKVAQAEFNLYAKNTTPKEYDNKKAVKSLKILSALRTPTDEELLFLRQRGVELKRFY